MVLKRSGRGAVGRAFIRRRRYYEDKKYRKKYLERTRQYKRDSYKRNREERLTQVRNWTKEINEFANKRCKVCNKLLNYRSTIGLCQKHFFIRKKIRNPIILMFYRLISKLQ